ncbi:centrosomal protein of 104 kDa [Cimex lectularius]|uniref:Centrosomal protein of 104 kDa n=1 Tax=Cimex lectularius TaxID=79782 RepID=A0A8I6R9U0_CIMLE|nr:centrosomal protein of 104 kDa [Cimex lectularius]
MPRKIPFKTIYATSEDEKFRCSELDTQGPTVRGWQSQKDPSYPQDLILKLEKPVFLTQVQILAHQFMIPDRIELWSSSSSSESPISSLPFDYLGYVILGDNRSSSHKSRELKSVTIPPSSAKSSHIKLTLLSNHENELNVHNQVGLVAVQILGEDKEEATEASIFDDLSFDMYVDRDVARIIRQMECRKSEAVKGERFRYAARLKSAMLTLRTVGEKLGRLEVGKFQAIANEDYAKANKKKEQMDMLRSETYASLCVTDLLEESGALAKNDAPGSDITDSNTTLSEEVKTPDVPVQESQNTPVSPLHYAPVISKGATIVQPIRTGSLKKKKQPTASPSSYEAYDERIIPAAQRSVTVKETTTNINPNCLKMNEREKKQASLPISVFGIALVEKFYSRQYVDKEDGLRDLECILESQETTNKIFRAATFLLHRAIRDKVLSVYTVASSLVTQLFSRYTGPRVTTSELGRSVDKLLPELFSKSGDPTPRVHNLAVHTILTMAHSPQLRKLNIIPVHLTRALTASTHPRLALSKLEMVEQLILSIGISTDKASGMTARTLAEFGASGLHHPAEAVRKVAERVLILVYRVNPRLVRKQLPPDDDITRRNLLYRQLMKEFDKIDLEVKRMDLNRETRQHIKSSVSSYAANMSESPEVDQNVETPNSLPGNNKHCIFCFQTCEHLTEEGLNIHYWKYCPLLTRCTHCQEVVECTGIHNHLLKDCDLKELYRPCDNCTEAVEKENFEEHLVECQGINRCPFCKTPVENTDLSWRNHLLDGKTCPKHPRAKFILRSGSSTPRDSIAANLNFS